MNLSSLCQKDHVVEIGAGKGHITDKLLSRCGRVTAIEIDRGLFNRLSAKYEGKPRLRLVCGDFIKWGLPETPYKVFANIPFNRTTEIMKKLTLSGKSPEEAWLVMEKGAAKRFLGKPHETASSLFLKPLFDCGIQYYFRREDFHPATSVDAVLLHLKKKQVPDISGKELQLYRRFIESCCSKPNEIYRLLTRKQISTSLRMEGLSRDTPSGEMLYIQWLCLFRCYMKYGRHGG